MTKLDADLITSLPASDSGSAAVWGSKRINPRPQSCLCLTWSGCPLNDDNESINIYMIKRSLSISDGWQEKFEKVLQSEAQEYFLAGGAKFKKETFDCKDTQKN